MNLAGGLALAAEKGRLGETTILAAEPKWVSEHLARMALTPGGFKVIAFPPAALMAAAFRLLEPLERLAGLPAFMSRETVRASPANLFDSSAKARRELG